VYGRSHRYYGNENQSEIKKQNKEKHSIVYTIDKLFSPLTIRNGFTLANRIVFAPIYLNLNADSEEFRNFYSERAQGGAGLIIAPVPTLGGLSDLSTSAFRRSSLRLIAACRECDSWIIPQVFSGVGDWVNTMGKEELSHLTSAFTECAENLRDIGFPGMEIHGAHHSLFMHLLSPVINQRRDCYNGTLEARARLQIETVQAIKSRVGSDFSLFYRISATDLLPDGFMIEEAKLVGMKLQEAGLDCLDISVGGTALNPSSECPDHTNSEACFVKYFSAVKQAVSIPVIGVGRISSGEMAEMIIRRKKADLVALGRQLVADPYWPLKVKERRECGVVPMDEWYRRMPKKRPAEEVNA
jgi:2,4-dienoyl-CoA reductase-like NADH-dependent reductase (Old Yellow Enzyme family)